MKHLAEERGRTGPVSVRTYRAWYAHAALSMLALAWLAGTKPKRQRGIGINDQGIITYTVPEFRRLLVHLILRHFRLDEHVWSWSRWRRRRQQQARSCHYRIRGASRKCRCNPIGDAEDRRARTSNRTGYPPIAVPANCRRHYDRTREAMHYLCIKGSGAPRPGA
ncbi:conserved hypothetical protein (plasmid) [Rhodococcus jostii RHA1]|uniref:Transposase n=1 Tax=Rhodococcus jostii (strain RHA1) TaxID=101510 RepID=Q0RX91_RHOJR|nr:conserved hypothetical protein [Rhodococcus jostii RHA1]